MIDNLTSRRDYFMLSERLGFGTWQNDDDALAATIWGDAEVTNLTGGPLTPKQVRERLDAEIANQRVHGSQYWPLFQLDRGHSPGVAGFGPAILRPAPSSLGSSCVGTHGDRAMPPRPPKR